MRNRADRNGRQRVKLMTSKLMSTLNMNGHGDKTERKGGEKQEKHKARTDR
jgi:hypothetical protein